ncbi:hypothetical protein JCM10908_004914 [Rhodotorula pacifica]|uniref:HD domain-containing protein n=1 Tax=Rhodotorula pacifica TaxID=1495444 RepID=UPI003176B598
MGYTDQESALIRAAELRAQAHHAQYDPSHDFYHVDRVRRLALSIAHSHSRDDSLDVDVLVIELAALFHDLIDAKYLPKEGGPAPTARTTLAPFWQRHDNAVDSPVVDEERRRLVERIVENVSYSKEVKRIKAGEETEWHRACRELHCVQDADKLDAIGAFGIMRCAAYSAIANRPLFVPPSPPSLSPPPASSSAPSPKAGPDALSHFDEKLFKLEGMMKTSRGRELARKRTEVMRGFVEEVRREWREGLGEGEMTREA